MSANPQPRHADVLEAIAGYLASRRADRATVDELAERALGIARGGATHSDKIQIAKALGRLGFERKRIGGGAREWEYVRARQVPAAPKAVRLALDAIPPTGYWAGRHDLAALPGLARVVRLDVDELLAEPEPWRLVLRACGPGGPGAPFAVHGVAADSAAARASSDAIASWDGIGPLRRLGPKALRALAAVVTLEHGTDRAHGSRAARTVGTLEGAIGVGGHSPSVVRDRGVAAYVAQLAHELLDGRLVALDVDAVLEGRAFSAEHLAAVGGLTLEQVLERAELRLHGAETWDGSAWRSLALPATDARSLATTRDGGGPHAA